MQNFVMQAMKELEKTIASQNRQLKAFRTVIASDMRKMKMLKAILREYQKENEEGNII